MAVEGFDIAADLRRIGAAGPLKPGTPENLSALHEAHCAAVPFENLDILLDDLLHVLAEDFGLRFPVRTRFSRSEF